MNTILNIVAQYWGIVGGAVLVIALGLFGWKASGKSANVYAKDIAKAFMFLAEKRAEELLLATGEDKFKFVVNSAYDLFPSIVRTFISKPVFETIVQAVYDETIALVKAHQTQDQPVAATPVTATPTQDVKN
jgi:hypothetical protein